MFARGSRGIVSLFGCVLLSAALVGRADEISWASAVDGAWTDGSCWTGGIVPGDSDTAVINKDGTYVVLFGGVRSVGAVTLDGATPTLWIRGSASAGHTTLTALQGFANAATLRLESVNSKYASNLTISGGSLTNGPAGVIQANAGSGGERRISGNVTNEGAVNVGAGALLDIAGTDPVFNQNAGSITADGTFRLNGGTFNFNGGIVSGNTYVLNSRITVANTVVDTSTFRAIGTSPTLADLAAPVVLLWVQGGSLGGHTTLHTAEGATNAGTIRLESINSTYDSVIQVDGSTFTNLASGLIDVYKGTGGTRQIAGNLTNAGRIQVASDVPLWIPGTYNAAGGTITGPGYLINATLNVTASPADPTTILVTGPNCVIGSDNLARTEIWVQGNNSGSHTTLRSASGFVNHGTLHFESIHSTYASNLTIDAGALQNASDGLVRVDRGTAGERRITGNVTNEGTIKVGTGTQVEIRGTEPVLNQNAGSITADGILRLNDGTFNFSGGTVGGNVYVSNSRITVTDAVTEACTFQAVGTSPTLLDHAAPAVTLWVQGCNLGGHTTLHTAEGATNAGTIRLESINSNYESVIQVDGSTFTNQASGLIDVYRGTAGTRQIAGNLTNAGRIQVAGDTLLRIPGTYNAAGGTISGPGYLINAMLNVTASPADPTTIVVTGANSLLGTDNLARTEIWVQGSNLGNHTTLKSASGFANHGTLRLESVNSNYACNLLIAGGVLQNANDGLIQVNPGRDGDRRIRGNVTNEGTISVAAGTFLEIDGTDVVFDQAAGALTADGTFRLNGGSFVLGGGTVSGNVYAQNSQITILDTAVDASTFRATGASATLVDHAAPAVTLWVQGCNLGGHTTLHTAEGAANAGTIRLESITSNYASQIQVDGSTFTNLAGGLIDVHQGSSGTRQISGNLTNKGQINVAGDTLLKIYGTYNADGGDIAGPGYLINGTLNVTASPADPTTILVTGSNSVLGTDNLANTEIWVQGCSLGGHTTLRPSAGFVNHGTIHLESRNSNYACNVNMPGQTLRNATDGLIDVQQGNAGDRIITGTVNNEGTIRVGANTLLEISGTFENFKDNTLTDGTYELAGTLRFSNAAITTNAAEIVLDGPGSAIVNQSYANALKNFARNDKVGQFTITNDRDLTSAAPFANDGTLDLGPGSTFQVPGDFTQSAEADLVVELAGTDPSTQFGRLTGSGKATLAGTLNIVLAAGYVPQIGDRFEIVRFATRSGEFAGVNGRDIDDQIGFAVWYRADSVLLVVVRRGCEGFFPGDANCDGDVNFDDIDCFVTALIEEAAWQNCGLADPECNYLCVNDMNGDGSVDFGDIDRFVEVLAGP